MILALAAIAFVAYLIGSIPSGVLLARLKNVDVRTTGSGNIGATNVARSAGKTLGLLTLVLDAAKGALPVLAADALELFPATDPAFDRHAAVVAGVAAVAGHVFPVFLGFRGGKGVATALGVMIALAPWSLVPALATFALAFGLSRRVSLGSIGAAVAAPIGALLAGYPGVVVAGIGAIAILILVRHRGNVVRLMAGTEPRFGQPHPDRE